MSELKSLDDLKPAPYNPRAISPEAFTGLKHSVGAFGNISGLTWNQRTGNLVTGHQRLAALKAQYGDRLKLDNHSVACPNGDRWPIRVVDWEPSMEKAANVAANSPEIAGEFTPDLGPILEELKTELPELSLNLKLDALEVVEASDSAGNVNDDNYSLIFKFTKEQASEVQERLHEDREKHQESLDLGWRERCLLRLLRMTD